MQYEYAHNPARLSAAPNQRDHMTRLSNAESLGTKRRDGKKVLALGDLSPPAALVGKNLDPHTALSRDLKVLWRFPGLPGRYVPCRLRDDGI